MTILGNYRGTYNAIYTCTVLSLENNLCVTERFRTFKMDTNSPDILLVVVQSTKQTDQTQLRLPSNTPPTELQQVRHAARDSSQCACSNFAGLEKVKDKHAMTKSRELVYGVADLSSHDET